MNGFKQNEPCPSCGAILPCKCAPQEAAAGSVPQWAIDAACELFPNLAAAMTSHQVKGVRLSCEAQMLDYARGIAKHAPANPQAGEGARDKEEMLDLLESAARQECHSGKVERDYNGQKAGTIVTDSGAISTRADLLLMMAKHGRFRIVAEGGRIVVGYWPENDPMRPAVSQGGLEGAR